MTLDNKITCKIKLHYLVNLLKSFNTKVWNIFYIRF